MVGKKEILKVFDLLNTVDLLEETLAHMTEEERDELYSHPLVKEFDLLP